MTDWATHHHHPAPRPAPRLEFLEVRDDLLRSQLVPSLDAGRALADEWRLAVLAKGTFTELPIDPPAPDGA